MRTSVYGNKKRSKTVLLVSQILPRNMSYLPSFFNDKVTFEVFYKDKDSSV